MTSCTACKHADRAALDAAIAAGGSVRALAGRFGLSKSALARHRVHAAHVTVLPAPDGAPDTTALPTPEPAPVPSAPLEPAAPAPEPPLDLAPGPEALAVAVPDSGPGEDEGQGTAGSGRPRLLSLRQERAVLLLASGARVAQVVAETGAGERSVRRWLTLEPFQARLRDAMARQRQVFEAKLFQLGDKATAVVERLLEATRSDGKPNTEAQATGAKLVLNASVRLASRYKELQAEGHAPKGPIIALPAGTSLFAGPPPSWVVPRPDGRFVGDSITEAAMRGRSGAKALPPGPVVVDAEPVPQ